LAEAERAALRAFQARVGLAATGYVDEATRTRLAEAAGRAREEAERLAREEALVPGAAERAGIRSELGLVGHPAGAGGEVFAASERAALAAFKAAAGLPATGYVDGITRTRLAAAAEVA
jgi:peptidoglycan hydrolase-like protein with peptidoglycan-binding domain